MKKIKLSRKAVLIVCIVAAVLAIGCLAYAAVYQDDNGLTNSRGGGGSGHGGGSGGSWGHGGGSGSSTAPSGTSTESSGEFTIGGITFSYTGTEATAKSASELSSDGSGVVEVDAAKGTEVRLGYISYNGTDYTVVGIDSGVFQRASRLRIASISIASTVTRIAEDAFGSATFQTSDGEAIPLESVPGYTYSVTTVQSADSPRGATVYVQEDAYAPSGGSSGHSGSGSGRAGHGSSSAGADVGTLTYEADRTEALAEGADRAFTA